MSLLSIMELIKKTIYRKITSEKKKDGVWHSLLQQLFLTKICFWTSSQTLKSWHLLWVIIQICGQNVVNITPYHRASIVVVQEAKLDLLRTEVKVREKQNGLDLLITRHWSHILYIKLLWDFWIQWRNVFVQINKKIINFQSIYFGNC